MKHLSKYDKLRLNIKTARTADGIVNAAKVADKIDNTVDIARTAHAANDASRTVNTVSDAGNAAREIKSAPTATSISDNIESVAKKYNLNEKGLFGEQGKNTRIFKCDDPIESSNDFYQRISNGGKHTALPNGKGVQTVFDDGTRIVYRIKTSTPGSPAVQISVTVYQGVKNQKIHFLK